MTRIPIAVLAGMFVRMREGKLALSDIARVLAALHVLPIEKE